METIEWEDTVMDDNQLRASFSNYGYDYDGERGKSLQPLVKNVRDRQAHVAFDESKKQAKWQVGEQLCYLIGNLMLKDMEAGKLLAEQLREYMKSLKE